MSLATRCPVCQTVFRVVQDQLKVSEGWVRCGRCAKVFNAFEGLFDLEREFPATRQPTPSQRVLEDLATRNRQPRPSTWGDEFEGDVRPAPPGPTTRPVARASAAAPATVASAAGSAVTAPPAIAPRAAPFATASGAASRSATPAPPKPATGPALPKPAGGPAAPAPAPQAARVPPPLSPRADTALPAQAPLPQAAAPQPSPPPITAPQVAAPQTPAPAPPQTPPSTRPGTLEAAGVPPEAMPAPTTSAVAQPQVAAPRLDGGIAIRDEPLPVPGTTEIEVSAPDEAIDALVHSDGEMAPPDTAGDLDINLDSDLQPAPLDDAVDSRLLTFVQQADRAERWRRPWVRMAMALAALGLVVLLAAQLLVAQRDAVVARWPELRPLAQALCAPLECRIEPLRRIDLLGVDSSGLTRIDDGPVYRLVLVLRNRGDTALLIPSIDLVLTDAGGALVSRRMFTAADLGTPRTTIGAGQELPLQALLLSAERTLAGYTIEIFYP